MVFFSAEPDVRLFACNTGWEPFSKFSKRHKSRCRDNRTETKADPEVTYFLFQ